MQYTHDHKQAVEYAKLAMNRIKRENLPATPDIYELWYVYYSGQSPEVMQAVDVLVSNDQEIGVERCKELYYKFLSSDYKTSVVKQASDDINHTLKSVSGVVAGVRTATSEYSGKLGGMSEKISDIKDPQELKSVLSTVMEDTQAMMSQNQELEEQLTQSSEAMEQMKKDLEKIRREAMTDGLTGLANRKSFDEEILSIHTDTSKAGGLYSLMMLDIDHFKSFNDHYGHQVGDQVLRLVARTLTDGVKGRDIAARYGGEEFAIILPETPLDAALKVGESLRKAVATKDVINRNSGEKLGRITMSAGVAEYVEGEGFEALIERADAALYTAKHNGRNQVAAAPTPKSAKTKAS